jgi:hypothetical protein
MMYVVPYKLFLSRRRRSVPPCGVRFPYFFSLDGRSPVSHPMCRRISERDDPGPPVVPGGLGIGLRERERKRELYLEQQSITGGLGRRPQHGLGIPNPRKSGSVIWADWQRFGPSCVLMKRCHKAERRVGV